MSVGVAILLAVLNGSPSLGVLSGAAARLTATTLSPSVVSIATGGSSSFALSSDGTLWAWGDDTYGQLGISPTTLGSTYTTSPQLVPGLTGVVAVGAGDRYGLALRSDGTVWDWGDTSYEEPGNSGSSTASPPAPVAVSSIVAISAGSYFALALKNDGTVWGWGDNTDGQLGSPSLGSSSGAVPGQVPNLSEIVSVSAGYNNPVAVKSDGTLWAWGGSSGNSDASPPGEYSSISNVKAAASSGDGATVVLKRDGTLWAVGDDTHGQLGNGSLCCTTIGGDTFSNQWLQVVAATQSGTVPLTGIVSLPLSGAKFAIRGDGTAWAWGDNSYGVLGDGTTTTRWAAVEVSGLTGVGSITSNSANSLALTSSATLWGWGHNNRGQLGTGSTTGSLVPALVVWSPSAPSGTFATPEDESAVVTWSPPASSGAGPITSYTVTSSGGQQTTVAAPATRAVVSALDPGSTYSFTVTASNQMGTGPSSAPSNPVTIIGPPARVAGVVAAAGNGTAGLTWPAAAADGSPITQYVVTSYTDGIPGERIPTGSSATTFTVPGLVNGVSYTFTVAAQNMWGVGAASPQSNAVTPDVRPGPPGAPMASAGNGQATLYWTPPVPNGGTPVQQYVVTAYPSNGLPTLSANTNSSLPTYTFTGLINGVTYTFSVAAQNSGGVGALSPSSNAVTPTGTIASGTQGSINGFQYGELQVQVPGQSGCGPNADLEPQIAVSSSGTVLVASERGLGGGSDVWRAPSGTGGASATACAPTYAGQPNAESGTGASGGDVAIAMGSSPASGGTYPVYVASLNRGSISVAHSTDDGQTFVNVALQGGLPDDDREWIAAWGSSTSLLSFHDASSNIDMLRSDNGGLGYLQVAQPIPVTDYRATTNEIGSLVIDHRTTAGVSAPAGSLPGFWAYQAFVAPSSSNLTAKNQMFVAASSDGGFTWSLRPIGCSISAYGLDHAFPVLSVDPSGMLWAAWADPTNVYTAVSADHGVTWSCSGSVSQGFTQAFEPALVATSAGVDLAYYATPTAQYTWSVYFVQNLTGSASGWGTPLQLNTVHSGLVCTGDACGDSRQLYEDFGIDVDASGWAHIAYSHDGPKSGCTADLGCAGTYTGYLVQTTGTQVGYRN